MLFEKLKIYNTKEKLLERLKEIKREEEMKRNTPMKEKDKRTFSTSQSQRTTLNSLNRLSTSPKVQCILGIEKIKMPLTFERYSKQFKFKDKEEFFYLQLFLNIKKIILIVPKCNKDDRNTHSLAVSILQLINRVQTPQPPQKTILERLNEQEEEKMIKELIENYKPEQYDDMMENDQQEIERQNDEAQTNSMKQFSYQDYSPQRMNLIKKHQHHHHKSNPSHLKNNQRYDEQKQLYLQQLEYKGDINQEFNTDRGKYMRKFRLANKNLNKVSQEDFRKTIKQFNKFDDYAQFYKQTPNLYMQLNKSSHQQQIFQSGLGLVQQCNHIQVANAQALIRSPQQVKVFSEALKTQQCKTLTHLKLNHNKLNSLKIQQLTKSFPQHLQELDLMNNGLDSKSCQLLWEIMSQFLQLPQFKYLNIRNYSINEEPLFIFQKTLYQLLYQNIFKNHKQKK